MDLRISFQAMVNRALASTRARTDRLGVLQSQATTGKRILRVSDDPLAAAGALALNGRDQQVGAYLNNLQSARSHLDAGVSTLRQIGNVLTQARDVALAANHSVNDGVALEALAQQVDGLLARVLELANTQHAGRYLFSGTAETTPPFTVTGRDSQGRPMQVAYQGSLGRADVAVSTTMRVDLLYLGEEIFQARQRQTTVYTGGTGASAGLGTDNATGKGELLVQHILTTYAGGSGVQAGASSVAGDTVLGPPGAHWLTLVDTSGSGTGGIVSLNGGPEVPFTSADSDLRVPGPNGEVVFIDTTSIVPGFSGTVPLTADGTLSVDGGATQVPITFSANQAVTHGSTGTVTHVNSTFIRRTGRETLDYVGAQDVFETLIALRDELRAAAGETPQVFGERLSRRGAALDRLRENVLRTVGEQSVALENLERLQTHVEDLQIALREQAAKLEAVDLGELVLSMQQEHYLLQLTLASAARLFDQSLADFLR